MTCGCSRLRAGRRYDFILVKDKFLSGVSALLAARLFGLPYLFWLSYPFPESYLIRARDGTARYPFLYRVRGAAFHVLLYRLLLPAARHVFVQSEQMRRDIAAAGVPESKLTAVPMGVRLATLARPEGDRTSSDPRARTLLSLSRHARSPAAHHFCRAGAGTGEEQLPDVKLYLVGAGDDPRDEQELIDEAARLGVQLRARDDRAVAAGAGAALRAWRRMSACRRFIQPPYSTRPRRPSSSSTWPWVRP